MNNLKKIYKNESKNYKHNIKYLNKQDGGDTIKSVNEYPREVHPEGFEYLINNFSCSICFDGYDNEPLVICNSKEQNNDYDRRHLFHSSCLFKTCLYSDNKTTKYCYRIKLMTNNHLCPECRATDGFSSVHVIKKEERLYVTVTEKYVYNVGPLYEGYDYLAGDNENYYDPKHNKIIIKPEEIVDNINLEFQYIENLINKYLSLVNSNKDPIFVNLISKQIVPLIQFRMNNIYEMHTKTNLDLKFTHLQYENTPDTVADAAYQLLYRRTFWNI